MEESATRALSSKTHIVQIHLVPHYVRETKCILDKSIIK